MHFINTYTCLVFTNAMFSWLYLSLRQTQKFKNNSPLSLQKKKQPFACAIFGKICYVACAINCAGKLIRLCACLHERDLADLIDKPVWPIRLQIFCTLAIISNTIKNTTLLKTNMYWGDVPPGKIFFNACIDTLLNNRVHSDLALHVNLKVNYLGRGSCI